MTVTKEFQESHTAWRDMRMAKLTAEDGWLNLLGRWWVTPGVLSIGKSAECDISLPVGPDVLGKLTLNADDTGQFAPVNGAPVELDKATGKMSWRADRFLLEITSLNDLRALRIRDTQSDAAARMKPIEFFPLNPSLRITARLETLSEPMSITLDTVIGVPNKVSVTHVAKFEYAGQQMAMLATYGTADRPQFVFRDLTSLDDTYADMRFVFGEDVTADSVVLDFNRAVNPPCAFTKHAVCPLPPRENLFMARIEAGERRL